jgi:protein phosphatase PTC1
MDNKLYNKKQVRPINATSVGHYSETNFAFRHVNEDEHDIKSKNNIDYYGVYDGHGGKYVATYCKEKLSDLILDEISKLDNFNEKQIYKIFEESFKTIDFAIQDLSYYTGTTVVSCLVCRTSDKEKILFTANAGDARAVLVSKKSVKRLSFDHKPTESSEIKRINELGGNIVFGRVNGTLAVSRAIGDHHLKKYVISTPYTSKHTLCEDDQWLIVACDGVWDVLSDEHASETVKLCKNGQEASEALVKLSLNLGSRDNITAIVVQL